MASEPILAGITPRWEWRTFAPALKELRAQLPPLTDIAVKRSRETYIVCRPSSHNAKIRSDVLDVKQLFKTDTDGLQLWKPVLKESFPLTATAIKGLFAIWEQDLPATARAAYTQSQFLAEIVGPRRDLRAVEVEKSRAGFQFMDCTAEIAQVTFDGIALETFCVEHTDTQMILRALERLKLRGADNVNYAEAIKRTLGFGMDAAAQH